MKARKRATKTNRSDSAGAELAMATVQIPVELVHRIDCWAGKHGIPTSSEAICRLVEVALSVDGLHSAGDALRTRAANLADRQIDQMGDTEATTGERATRKRRLTDGPSAFRSVRRDRPNGDE